MNLNNNLNYIFDFDGTIVDLHVNWKDLKEEVNKLCKQFAIETNQKLNLKIDLLKEKTNVLDIVKRFEEVDGKVSHTTISKTLELINSLDEFYVVSNNLNNTVEQVLEELNLLNKCKKIVAIDDVEKSKPSNESFLKIKESLKYEHSLYIGDRNTDKHFAENCNMKFKHVEEI